MGTIDQLDADLAFELADLAAQRGLGHVQALCRTTKMEFFGHNDEVTQLPNFDHRGAPDVGGQDRCTFYHQQRARAPTTGSRRASSFASLKLSPNWSGLVGTRWVNSVVAQDCSRLVQTL